jgi:hypothetical protein
MKCESQQSQRRLDVVGSNNVGRDSKHGRGRTFRMKENTRKARQEADLLSSFLAACGTS